jgi:hypothetical protein
MILISCLLVTTKAMSSPASLPVNPRTNYAALALAALAIAVHHFVPQLHVVTPSLRVVIMAKLVWCGIVVGISFIDSWVKFLSPVVMKYRYIGFEASRYVFAAANTAELILSVPCLMYSLTVKDWSVINLIPAVLLIIQVLYLQPVLDRRSIELTEHGIGKREKISPPKSAPHTLYIVFELAKIVSLLWWAYAHI